MESLPNGHGLPQESSTSLLGRDHRKYRAFAVCLICCAIFIAAFAITAIAMHVQKNGGFPIDPSDKTQETTLGTLSEGTGEQTTAATTQEAPTPIPEGATVVVSRDLSGNTSDALLNETPYRPELATLRELSVSERITSEPLVLILHTHSSEAYLPSSVAYLTGAIGDAVYSTDATRNVLRVGKVLCDTLNAQGIPTVHCTTLHDADGLSGSYSRSAETVKRYLEQYPSIRYVIDLHRDSVTTSDGAYVRSEAMGTDQACAQIMAVIGSDGNGTAVPNMERNLALALQLCERLNRNGADVCRAPYFKNASYNQELSQYGLLLEIGTGANTVEEACYAAELAGKALAELIKGT